jgi:hypothetical protein
MEDLDSGAIYRGQRRRRLDEIVPDLSYQDPTFQRPFGPMDLLLEPGTTERLFPTTQPRNIGEFINSALNDPMATQKLLDDARASGIRIGMSAGPQGSGTYFTAEAIDPWKNRALAEQIAEVLNLNRPNKYRQIELGYGQSENFNPKYQAEPLLGRYNRDWVRRMPGEGMAPFPGELESYEVEREAEKLLGERLLTARRLRSMNMPGREL